MTVAVMLQDAGHVVTGAGIALWVAHAIARRFRRPRPAMAGTGFALMSLGEVLYAPGALLLSQWLACAFAVALAALSGFLAWLGFRHPEVSR